MGLEVLVGCLWGAVLAYWLWTRRPASDTVGAFHRELQVLERATPARVVPANRLAPPRLAREHSAPPVGRSMVARPGPYSPSGASPYQAAAAAPLQAPGASVPQAYGSLPHQTAGALAPQVVAAVATNKRSELRRRRRDVLTLLVVVAGLTLLATVLSGSTVALVFQVSSDLALVTYLYLLSYAARAHQPIGFGGSGLPFAYLPRPSVYRPPPSSMAYELRTSAPRPRHVPARAGAPAGASLYGDFDSYASLA